MKKAFGLLLIAAFSLLILLPLGAKTVEEELKTYFVEGETTTGDGYVRIDYTFRGQSSRILVSGGSIDIPRTAYLTESDISRILSSSWNRRPAEYEGSDLEIAREVVRAVREFLDGKYPYTGKITPVMAQDAFPDMVRLTLTPYQYYTVTYFQINSLIYADEINYFEAIYSAGVTAGYEHRFTRDFTVGGTLGFNTTFGQGENFLNITPMFTIGATMFRVDNLEFTTRMGFGGFITINEHSLSFVPGMNANVGVQVTVSPRVVFSLEAGMDLGLWLWRTMSSEGFMLAQQKPVVLGMGIRL